MELLFIESATEKSVIFISRSGKPLASRFLTGGPHLSRTLALEVKQLLESHSFQPNQVAVGQGPGSFTGIRVGVALGQALAYGWGVPLVGIGSLEGFAPPVNGPFAILLDARSGGFYVLLGERLGEKILFEKPELLSLEKVEQVLVGIDQIASPHPEIIQKRLRGEGKVWFETAPDPHLLSLLILENKNTPVEVSYCSSP